MNPRVAPLAAALFIAALTLQACSEGPANPTAPSSLATSAAPVSSTAAGGGEVSTTDAPAESPAAANFEVRFMTGMIDHHQMAIEMAEICLAEAIHPELRAMCEGIIATQSSEIDMMQGWLQDWYGITYEPMMKPGDMRMMERLASRDGAEFEIAFMEMMIKHHEGAIKEARHCLNKAEHPELLALCEGIVATQSSEIATMEGWLCAWYGECRPHA